ncbi:SGNH hydrolase [Durotheca rogersii]|uniref:SGNH hydrolase n=1 Tax=Durotheca rogersii TaxID=419775 RepID=UPI0022200499|nr:SGNH hydrolase [Durotheca rogersii]KAI5863110.1 SGNH hydrolase [Durotheca rogersii]
MARPYNQVVLFGDSLIQGASEVQDGFSFQGALQSHCMRYLDVINRGFSGYNTKNALDLLPQVFLPPSPANPKIEYLLVLLGANDACLPIPTNTQGVPIDQYKENLIRIVTHDHVKAHNPKILLVTPPPVDQIRITELDLAVGHAQATREAAVSAAYSETAREVAAAVPGVVVIDLERAIVDRALSLTVDFDADGPPLGHPGGVRGGLEQLLPDGLHLSGESYRVFFDIVKPHIGPFAEEQTVFPNWRVLNPGTL